MINPAEKDLGILVDEKLNISQQYVLQTGRQQYPGGGALYSQRIPSPVEGVQLFLYLTIGQPVNTLVGSSWYSVNSLPTCYSHCMKAIIKNNLKNQHIEETDYMRQCSLSFISQLFSNLVTQLLQISAGPSPEGRKQMKCSVAAVHLD